MADNNYKRIARNTLLLYGRFAVTLVVSLFTSRVVLQALGFDDFGLYNVVGGFVTLLAFMNGYISQGTTRFLTYHLGAGDKERLKSVFSASLALHVSLALLLIVAGETVGTWYIEQKLNMTPGREDVAMFVFHLSLITGCLSVIQTPFHASITAHEDMGMYAYISIFDVVMKLVIVYLLVVTDTDKLRLYAVFFFCVSLTTWCFYMGYCLRKYAECALRLKPDIPLYKEMFVYIGWNAIGTTAFTLNGQGITVLLNLFFGTVINAARGVAGSVSNIVSQFVFNFQTAMRPQIVKRYAERDLAGMSRLVLYGSKYSSYLCILFGIPIFIEADTILHLWLGNVPPYAADFVRLTIIQIQIQAMDFPIGYGINAVGRMRLPNITSSLVYLLILPISYLSMRAGANPTVAYMVSILCYPLAMIFDVWILHKYAGFGQRSFYRDVLCKTTLFTLAAAAPPYALHAMMTAGLLRLATVGGASVLCTAAIVYACGLDHKARAIVRTTIRNHIPFSHR